MNIPAELNPCKVYQVDGILYRYVPTTSYGYLFRPLPGQFKKEDLKLSRSKLSQKCKEVVGMSVYTLFRLNRKAFR